MLYDNTISRTSHHQKILTLKAYIWSIPIIFIPNDTIITQLVNSEQLIPLGKMSYEKTGDRDIVMTISIPEKPEMIFKRADYISIKAAKLSVSKICVIYKTWMQYIISNVAIQIL